MTDRRNLLFLAEVALVALTIAATISLERLFTDLTFLRDLVVMLLGSHLVAAVCRRAARAPPPPWRPPPRLLPRGPG